VLDVHFVILGVAIGGFGTGLYLRDTWRGVTQPHRVTWLLWAGAPLLAFAVEIQAGVGLRSLMTFGLGVSPLLVVAASFHNPKAVWRPTRTDYLCGVLSLAGLVAWVVTQHGTVALVVSIGADALAAAPTIKKSWTNPETETAATYATGVVNAGITLLTIKTITTAEVAFPVYIFCLASLQTVLVGGRPRLRERRARATSHPAR
jgi:hypothetical protein